VCAVRTVPLGADEWLVGCTFASKITDEEIQQLIALVGMNGAVHPAHHANGKPDRHPVKLRRKQELAIAALVEDSDVSHAAKAAAVTERTLRGWLVLPQFQHALCRARKESVDTNLSRLIRLAGQAAAILERHLSCGQPAVEVQAAGEILRLALSFSRNGTRPHTNSKRAQST
jgi:hypothetical protein